jgi:hypothetical protein
MMNMHERITPIRELTDDEISAVSGGDVLGALTGGAYGSIAEVARGVAARQRFQNARNALLNDEQ